MRSPALTLVALFAAVLSRGAARADHPAATAAAGQEPAPAVEKLIADGVALHDAGKLDEAIEQYKRALEIDAGNPTALYELAVTYFSSKQYDLCATTARQGFAREGPLQGSLFTVAGSCLSAAGKADEALEVFTAGLAKHPNDANLNFNNAITLFHGGKAQQAVPYLEKAIEVSPASSSPYLALGEILASEKRAVEGIFLLLKFLSLEINSQRTAGAATRLFGLLGADQSGESRAKYRSGLGSEIMDDPFGPLELMRAMAAGSMRREEEQAKSVAARHVTALGTLVKIVDEVSRGELGPKLTDTFVWKRAAAPIVELQRQGLLECFGHVLAARAGLAGAEEWLAGNAQKKRELESALAELRR